MNEFVAPPQEQTMHHQHPHSMVEPDKVIEIPNQIEIKQVRYISIAIFSVSGIENQTYKMYLLSFMV